MASAGQSFCGWSSVWGCHFTVAFPSAPSVPCASYGAGCVCLGLGSFLGFALEFLSVCSLRAVCEGLVLDPISAVGQLYRASPSFGAVPVIFVCKSAARLLVFRQLSGWLLLSVPPRSGWGWFLGYPEANAALAWRLCHVGIQPFRF